MTKLHKSMLASGTCDPAQMSQFLSQQGSSR